MEFQGTKGEWTYSPQQGEKGHCFEAQVWANGVNLANFEPTTNPKESTANAALLTAAPDLLKVVQSMIENKDLWCPPIMSKDERISPSMETRTLNTLYKKLKLANDKAVIVSSGNDLNPAA